MSKKIIICAFVVSNLIFLQAQDFKDSNNAKNNEINNAKLVNEKSADDRESKYLVGATIAFVNDEPITLYELNETQKIHKLDKKKAMELLIMDKLKNEEVKRLKIAVSDDAVDNQIAQIAAQNNMQVNDFLMRLQASGMNMDDYKQKLKEQMQSQELIKNILMQSNIGQDDALRKYYNQHQDEFSIPKIVSVKKFVSNNKNTLEKFIKSSSAKNDNVTLPQNIKSDKQDVEMKSLTPQISDVFIATKKGHFTPILNIDDNFVSFLVLEKKDVEKVDFEKAKNFIVQKLMITNQEKIIKDYFERVKDRTKIVYSKFY